MPTILMALYRRPEGGEEALETFRRRYAEEHLPLVRQTPGLRSLEVENVTQAFGETDVFLVARMAFDDRASLDTGLGSDPMRQAGRNLREIAPGLSTLVVLEHDEELSDVPARRSADAASAATDGGASSEDARTGAAPSLVGTELPGNLEPAEGRPDADQ